MAKISKKHLAILQRTTAEQLRRLPPQTEIDMSKTLQDFIEPFADLAGDDPDRYATLLRVGSTAWNLALVMDEVDGAGYFKERGPCPHAISSWKIFKALFERKKTVYEQANLVIRSYELKGCHLGVFSEPLSSASQVNILKSMSKL